MIVPADSSGHRSWLFGAGYRTGLQTLDTSSVSLQLGYGFAPFAKSVYIAREHRVAHVNGMALFVHAVLDGEIAVPRGDAPSNMALSARVAPVLMHGVHVLGIIGSIGLRWDIKPGELGLRTTTGLWYALRLRRLMIPLSIEAVRDSGGALAHAAWGLRILISAPVLH